MEYLVHPQDGMIDQNSFMKCFINVCVAECDSLCGANCETLCAANCETLCAANCSLCGARACFGKMVPEPYGG